MHGEYKHLIAQAKIAEELGYDSDHIKILSSGDVLEIDENGAEVTGHVPVGNVMVDGLGVGDVGNIVLRDRQRLAEDGIIIVVMTLENGTGQVLAGPDIVSRGFVYVRNSESLMDEAKTVLDKTMDYCMDHNITDWGKIKNEVKDALGDFVWKETKRRPMIMPIIMKYRGIMNKALFTFIKIAFVIMLILLILYGTVHLCRTCYDYGYRFFAEKQMVPDTQDVESTEAQ